jgi:TonB family protein
VTAPELLNADHISIPMTGSENAIPPDAQVGLSLTVDEKGHPQNVKVVKSLDAVWDARVVDAISRSRFKPASVDDQPTAIDLYLTVNIAR